MPLPRLPALLASALVAGCANAPPPAALGLLSSGQKPMVTHFGSLNVLSNQGRTGFQDGRTVENSGGRDITPTFENEDFAMSGALVTAPFLYMGWALVNLQPQVTAGFRWEEHLALGYFPTFSLHGKRVLHGVQADLRILPSVAVASAQLYQENLPSILPNAAMGEAGPNLAHAVAAASLHFSLPVAGWRFGVVPNWRRSLDYPQHRYGVNLVFSGTAPIEKKNGSKSRSAR